MPIFRRTNCIIAASGIVTLCTVQYSMPDESRLQSSMLSSGIPYSRLQRVTIPDTGDNMICPPEDGHVNARNMSRIVV
jgi:hypothetical protein